MAKEEVKEEEKVDLPEASEEVKEEEKEEKPKGIIGKMADAIVPVSYTHLTLPTSDLV